MQTTTGFYHNTRLIQHCMSYKNTLLNLIASLKFEKIIFSFNAIFEGIGIAGIISAAFWYATAPMAPDGFKGPIATLTIATSTIASLIIAIPIACKAYKTLIHNLENYYTEIQLESKHFDDRIEELHFELLKLRAFFNSDREFLIEIKTLMHCQVVELIALSVCQLYSIYKNKYYSIKWDAASGFSIYESTNSFHSMRFTELLKQNSLTNIKAFRKTIVKFAFTFILNNEFKLQQIPTQKHIKYVSFALVAGITCTEVLLSIGWTVASILIGLKVIMPISLQNWTMFACFCLGLGPLFGMGVYFNKWKQNNRDLLKYEVRMQNITIKHTRENIDILFAKKMLEQNNLIDLNVSSQYPKKSKVALYLI